MNLKVDRELVEILKIATGKAFASLFNNYDEKFYYCSLITDGEGNCPLISAWSEEALARVLLSEENPEEAELELKWSYADSPYCLYGEEYFTEANEFFNRRTEALCGDEDWEDEFEIRINSMEQAMAELDAEGLFCIRSDRSNIVINAEVMPPDVGNTERALRLNPRKALDKWLEEAAVI